LLQFRLRFYASILHVSTIEYPCEKRMNLSVLLCSLVTSFLAKFGERRSLVSTRRERSYSRTRETSTRPQLRTHEFLPHHRCGSVMSLGTLHRSCNVFSSFGTGIKYKPLAPLFLSLNCTRPGLFAFDVFAVGSRYTLVEITFLYCSRTFELVENMKHTAGICK
jgi:hypothetical protein